MNGKKIIEGLEEAIELANFAPGTMGCHEALHICSFLASAVDHELVQHPAIYSNHVWRRRAMKALDELATLYQEIGAAHL